ncbi:alpha/beta fold hydrolase [Amphritea balenae]|uniref:Alpha/beta hydrolase n=1 Tax=Amphritea balenae TaxID=452629 RepID=A0A3P1SLR5_9GAMM|nr:alpha/beta hydrolase [Amphritea balenae]RRC97899.1 alpha/beta hydrolase [Amphritea balenae]GGK81583.1 alpha/beta hydrolase [Amphritea balenae]
MEKITSKDGINIRYLRLGKGTPVIFLHGWTSSSIGWLPFASELADQHEVYCWDARGHGGHEIAEGASTHVRDMASDLQQLIEYHQLENVTLVGHSMGALTMWQYIRDFGCDKLSGVCIIDQSPKLVTDDHWHNGIYGNFNQAANTRFISKLREDFAEGLLQLVANGYNRKSYENYQQNARGFQQLREHLRTLESEPLVKCWESLTAADYRDVLPQICVPALLIYGDESQFYSADVAEYVRRNIPLADLHTYENSDHSPQLWHRDRFVYDLRTFVTRLQS